MKKPSRYKRYISISEFLSLLEKTPREWTVSKSGDIRMKCLCPLAAVFGGVDLQKEENVGLSKKNKDEVMTASDFKKQNPLRQAILKACDLTEEDAEEDGTEELENEEEYDEEYDEDEGEYEEYDEEEDEDEDE